MQIVGVSLLRNEEYFAAWALMNAAAFCDRIIVMDNRSQDRTRRIVEAVAGMHPHIEIMDVRHARRTHKYLEPLVGTPTWVFAIDGDEIYDPSGLAIVREHLLSGECRHYYRLCGHYVHASGVLVDEGRAFGYSASPTDGMARLYNFEAIESWWGGSERLHGGSTVIRPGYTETGHSFWKQEVWDESVLRCLHLCFIPRSSLDTAGEYGRQNPAERYKERFLYQRLRRAIRLRLNPGVADWRDYKKRRYLRGPLGDFDISGFGAPSDFRSVDPACDEAMAVLGATASPKQKSE